MDNHNLYALLNKIISIFALKKFDFINKYLDILLNEDNDFAENYLYKIIELFINQDNSLDLKPFDVIDYQMDDLPVEYEELLNYYNNAFGFKKCYLEYLEQKADCLLNLGKFEESIKSFRDILNIDSNNTNGLLGISHCLYKLKKFNEA